MTVTGSIAYDGSGAGHEYKDGVKRYGDWFNATLHITDVTITVPRGPAMDI